MHHVLTNDTWTALEDHLVFAFRLHDDGLVRVMIACDIAPATAPQEFDLPPARERHFHLVFHSTGEGELYVRGFLRRDLERQDDGRWHGGVFGDIHYGHSGWHDDQHFEGYMVMAGRHPRPHPQPCPPTPQPSDPQPVPERGDDAPGGEADLMPSQLFGDAADTDLFPYVYLRRWPALDPATRQRCFIAFAQPGADPAAHPVASPPAGTLYEALCAAIPSGRTRLEALALSYADGAATWTPPFIGPLQRLPAPLPRFPEVADAALALQHDPVALTERVLALLGVPGPDDIAALLATPACQAAIGAAWQAYFALVILPGRDQGLLRDLGRFLGAAHLLAGLYGAAAPGAAHDRALLDDLAHAAIVLPQPLFPLPPRAPAPASPPGSDTAGAVAAYAVGDLQMVRQRLLRYEAGHIAHIDNVMRGEKKEIRRRRVVRQLDYEQEHGADGSVLENRAADERNNLLEEARKAVAEKTVGHAYDNFQTRYGPPAQGTLTGSWSESIAQGANPGADDMTRFAREVLSRTVHRITRQVDRLRGSSTLSENEDTVVSTIDNSAHARHLMGVYRWLNQVFEARVVNYGKRLLVEFTLPHPAQRLNAGAHRPDRAGDSTLRLPEAPSSFSFDAIHFSSYARLAAAYEVTELEPPPPLRKTLSATLRAGESALLAVPPGYMVATAEVNAVGAPAGALPQVLVGRHLLTPGADSGTRRTFGEDGSIAVAAGPVPAQPPALPTAPAASPPTSSPPAPPVSPPAPLPTAPPEVQVTVSIGCVPTPAAIDAWRIKTYRAIVAGYARQCARQAAGEAQGHALSPAQLRQVERRELRRGCMRLLLANAPAAGGSDAARLLQFLDECFEWSDMSYRAYAGGADTLPLAPAGAGGADSQFDSFLQAELARVLLPVHPRATAPLLYFLAAGSMWDGEAHLAPVHAADVAALHELRAGRDAAHGCGRRIGRAWEIRVPTAMQVLDGCPLPACRPARGGPAAAAQAQTQAEPDAREEA